MKKFYDIHMHAFNLSHPNLSLFLQREDVIDSLIGGLFKPKSESKSDSKSKLKTTKICSCIIICITIIATAALVIFAPQTFFWIIRLLAFITFLALLTILIIILVLLKKIKKYITTGKNLTGIVKGVAQYFLSTKYAKKFIKQALRTLTFFEIPFEYQFLVLDHFLRSKMKYDDDKKQIRIGETDYHKIVLCPLVIDFGRKSISDGVVYNLTPKTPTANQVGDLLYAIRTYYRFKVEVEGYKMELSKEIQDWENKKEDKLFEIYPFMGIDTRNYDTWDEIKRLLDKYFNKFEEDDSAEKRRERLFKKMGMLECNMYKIEEDYYVGAFAGIKLYPQLGFDPYPSNSKEFEKTDNLYKYCIEKRIPITTHCSDGGYKTGDNDILTSPLGRWKKVLERYPELTLNFAHFGSQKEDETEWRDAIIDLTKKYPNVYTDISCNDMSMKYYAELESILTEASNNEPSKELYKRVLFGSDFSINMLVTEVESYNQNLEVFTNPEFKLSYKPDLCEHNPERFLFGGEIMHK